MDRVNRNSARDNMDAIPQLCDVVRTLLEARPVLLILDGHSTRTNNMPFIKMARANFVKVICLSTHCSHRTQPLGGSFMKLLMIYYNQAVEYWLRSHPDRVVSTLKIVELFGIGYVRAATMRTVVNGLRKTGIWPIDRKVFDEHDFAAAQPTDLVRQPNRDARPPNRDTDAPPRDRDTDSPSRDRDTNAPPPYRDTDAPPRDRVTDAPPRDRDTVMSASPPHCNIGCFAVIQNQPGYSAESNKEMDDLQHCGQQDCTRG